MNKITMWTYINEEQDKLLKILENYPKEQDKVLKPEFIDKKNWLGLATGSSYNALVSSKYYIENIANVIITPEQPYQYAHYEQINHNYDLILGISQSGQSTSTIEAISKVKKECNIPVLSITSIPNSKISDFSDSVLDLQIGREKVGYVTLGFSSTVLGLMLLGLRLSYRKGLIDSEKEEKEIMEFKNIINNFDDLISKTHDFVKKNDDELSCAKQFDSIAYGPAVGSALEMQTKFTETIRIPCHGYELEAYMHGPYLALNKNSQLLFIKTNASKDVMTKFTELKTYERKYCKNIYTLNFSQEQLPENNLDLNLLNIQDEMKAPLAIAPVIQTMAWFMTLNHKIDLSILIFDDFSDNVHNKTQHQNYI